jgi:hypothetical protein
MPPNPIAHLATIFPVHKNTLSDYNYHSRMNARQIHTTRSRWVPTQSLVSASQELFASLPITAILTHPENDYHPRTGLKRANSPDNPNAFML